MAHHALVDCARDSYIRMVFTTTTTTTNDAVYIFSLEVSISNVLLTAPVELHLRSWNTSKSE